MTPGVEGQVLALERAWSELWEAGRIRAGEWRSASQALWAMASGIMPPMVVMAVIMMGRNLRSEAILTAAETRTWQTVRK